MLIANVDVWLTFVYLYTSVYVFPEHFQAVA